MAETPVNVDSILKINQQIEVVVKTGTGAGSYHSRVEELTKDAIYVATPLYKGYPLNYRKGDIIEVFYIYNKSAIYSFTTKVLQAISVPVPVLALAKPKDVQRIQRRNFVRIETRLPVSFSKNSHDVELIIKEGHFKGSYSTDVEEIAENYLAFYTPIIKERQLPLVPGIEVELVFTLQDGSKYSFCDTIKKIATTPTAIFTVDKPSILRLEDENQGITLPLEFRRFQTFIDEGIFKGVTLDLGGGGIMFGSPIAFEEGDKVDITLEFPEQGKIKAIGQILRCTVRPNGEYKNSLRFTRIAESDRDRIIQFIFQRQLELRRKGLM